MSHAIWMLSAVAVSVGPADDWCGAINAAPGETVILDAGEYADPCPISAAGVQVLGDGAVMTYDGDSSNVIDVLADDVTISGLSFSATQPGVDAIKIKSGNGTRVLDCRFEAVGGISVSANSASSDGVLIRGNEFSNLNATAIYLGCHDGVADCAATRVTVTSNFIDGVVSDGVGYGIQLKLDSTGLIADNVITNTQGPGIMVYGAADPGSDIEVTRNLVVGSTTAAAIELGGGPAVVTNNIVVGGAVAGIYSYDYQSRGLVENIAIVGNSVVGTVGPAIELSGAWTPDENLRLVGNAAWQQSGDGPAVPAVIDGVIMSDNVDCDPPGDCWVDAAARDFHPVADGSLVAGYTAIIPADKLLVDWCSFDREPPPTIGALQWNAGAGPGPLALAPKGACPPPAVDIPEAPPVPEDPPDTGRVAEPPDAGADEELEGGIGNDVSDDDGGCRAGGSGRFGPVGLLLLLALFGVRRRYDWKAQNPG